MKLLKTKILFFLVVIFLTSCLKNLDFTQIDNLRLKPVFESSLIYFTVQQVDFINNGIEVNTVSDIVKFPLFKNQEIKTKLIKTELTFEVDNKINRNFTINFDFLDANDKIVHSFSQLSIASGNRNFTQTQTVKTSSNSAFLNSKKIKITIHLLPSAIPLDSNVNLSLDIKTSSKFYISI